MLCEVILFAANTYSLASCNHIMFLCVDVGNIFTLLSIVMFCSVELCAFVLSCCFIYTTFAPSNENILPHVVTIKIGYIYSMYMGKEKEREIRGGY